MTKAVTQISNDQVWHWLSEVPDPEIPVVSITDLGIVREVAWEDQTLVVTVTPTYSGCPATAMISLDIEQALRAHGVDKLRLERRLSPPWTSDWIGMEAREKLRVYGIAPPVGKAMVHGGVAARIERRTGVSDPRLSCPRCSSEETEKISQFGSTPCKASYRCRSCLEPFEHFKCI